MITPMKPIGNFVFCLHKFRKAQSRKMSTSIRKNIYAFLFLNRNNNSQNALVLRRSVTLLSAL